MRYDKSQYNCAPCPQCGKDNLSFATFCLACGEPLVDLEAGTPSGQETARTTANNQGSRVARPSLMLHKLWRWESGLGLLLVALTLGYALYQWHTVSDQSNAFREGKSAEQKKDWDRALAKLERAGDLPGVASHVQTAREMVGKRDQLYSRGMSAAQNSQWSTAISALQGVQGIEPYYKDSARKLADVKAAAFSRGLEGIVYLVSDGNAPGLYLRDMRGNARLLPGSDRHSTVRAISPDSMSLVYDRPPQAWDYSAQAATGDSIAPGSLGLDQQARIPVVAQLSPLGVLSTMALPELDSNGAGIFASTGLWWYSLHRGWDFYGYEVSYISTYASKAVRVGDPQHGKQVIALDPAHTRVVMAETWGEARTPDYRTALYLANASGGNRRLLTTVRGEAVQVSVSLDGRYLLYTSRESGSSVSETVWVLPIDASNGVNVTPPEAYKLATITGSSAQPEAKARLAATFLPSGDTLTRIVVDRGEGDDGTVMVYTLDGANIVKAGWVWSNTVYGGDVSGFSHDGAYIATRQQEGQSAKLEIAGLGGDSPKWIGSDLHALGRQVVKTQFALRDDYVIASVRNRDGVDRGDSQAVYAAPMGKAGGVAGSGLREIARANLPYDQELSPIALPPNGYMMAYVAPNQELHAVFLDGTSDTVIAANVAAVWGLKSKPDLSWWR